MNRRGSRPALRTEIFIPDFSQNPDFYRVFFCPNARDVVWILKKNCRRSAKIYLYTNFKLKQSSSKFFPLYRFYIIPVVFIALIFALPRFFETKIMYYTENNITEADFNQTIPYGMGTVIIFLMSARFVYFFFRINKE